MPPLTVPSGTPWGVVPPLTVPSGEVWGVAPEGMDAAAAIPFACACALFRLSDTLMSATGLVPSIVRIGDVAVEGVADPGGADCGVADAPPLSDALLSAGPVFPEELLPAGLTGAPVLLEASLLAGLPLDVPDVVGPVASPGVSENVPPEDAGLTTELAGPPVLLEASLLAGPPIDVPDVVGPAASPGVSEGVPPEDAGRTTELAGETTGVTVAGVVEGPAAEEPVL